MVDGDPGGCGFRGGENPPKRKEWTGVAECRVLAKLKHEPSGDFLRSVGLPGAPGGEGRVSPWDSKPSLGTLGSQGSQGESETRWHATAAVLLLNVSVCFFVWGGGLVVVFAR